MTPLEQLEAAIAAGTFPEHLTPADVGMPRVDVATLYGAFSGSLDAAMFLHDDVLPGYGFDIWKSTNFNGDAYFGCNIPKVDTVYGANPARAWLLAIVRALIAKAAEAEQARITALLNQYLAAQIREVKDP